MPVDPREMAMVAKPRQNETQTVLTVKRETYRRMTEVRQASGKPTQALKDLFAQGMRMVKPD